MGEQLTAVRFVERLEPLRSSEHQREIQRYFKTGEGGYAEGDVFIGVRMGELFELAKEFLELPVDELEALLESRIHEVRAGALSIMDKHARRRRTDERRRAELYELYLSRHDRIDSWDLVDLAAPHVVGRYLADRDRRPLYELARSEVVWERRTAIMATLYLVRQDELDETYRVAELLRDDDHDLVHKPVGGLLRETGRRDRARLLSFLDEHAAAMPRTMLRYAIQHLDPELREHYRTLG
jgi:3-methyladenine DNA glycosylase AlkD